MRRTKLALLLILLLSCLSTASAQIPTPRLNIQYGDSNCYTNSLIFWTSLPDRGLVLRGAVTSFAHTGTTVAIAWIGFNRISIPWLNQFGQTCYFLASPDLVYVVPMHLGYGNISLFKIPISPLLIGVALFGQAAMVSGNHEDWSSGVEMVIQ